MTNAITEKNNLCGIPSVAEHDTMFVDLISESPNFKILKLSRTYGSSTMGKTFYDSGINLSKLLHRRVAPVIILSILSVLTNTAYDHHIRGTAFNKDTYVVLMDIVRDHLSQRTDLKTFIETTVVKKINSYENKKPKIKFNSLLLSCELYSDEIIRKDIDYVLNLLISKKQVYEPYIEYFVNNCVFKDRVSVPGKIYNYWYLEELYRNYVAVTTP